MITFPPVSFGRRPCGRWAQPTRRACRLWFVCLLVWSPPGLPGWPNLAGLLQVRADDHRVAVKTPGTTAKAERGGREIVAEPVGFPASRGAVGRATAAEPLYAKFCQRCHGEDGRGTAVRDIFPKIPDFIAAGWQKQRSDVQLMASILAGKGVSMPSFRKHLSNDQVRDLVAYVRGLALRPAQDSGDDSERRFRALQQDFHDLDQVSADFKE
jgi:mono/diheme cytochrome c family protein